MMSPFRGLPVTFCIDRAGIVGEDGVTHHGLFDIAYLRVIPGIKVAAPMDSETLRNIMYSSLDWNGPLAIRYPRGKADKADWHTEFVEATPGKGRCISNSDDSRVAVLTVGPVGFEAVRAIQELKGKGISADHYDMIWVKPLDENLLRIIADRYEAIVTVEDGVISGGFGSAVGEWLESKGKTIRLVSLGVRDNWVFQGSVSELRHDCGYDAASIVSAVEKINNAEGPIG